MINQSKDGLRLSARRRVKLPQTAMMHICVQISDVKSGVRVCSCIRNRVYSQSMMIQCFFYKCSSHNSTKSSHYDDAPRLYCGALSFLKHYIFQICLRCKKIIQCNQKEYIDLKILCRESLYNNASQQVQFLKKAYDHLIFLAKYFISYLAESSVPAHSLQNVFVIIIRNLLQTTAI